MPVRLRARSPEPTRIRTRTPHPVQGHLSGHLHSPGCGGLSWQHEPFAPEEAHITTQRGDYYANVWQQFNTLQVLLFGGQGFRFLFSCKQNFCKAGCAHRGEGAGRADPRDCFCINLPKSNFIPLAVCTRSSAALQSAPPGLGPAAGTHLGGSRRRGPSAEDARSGASGPVRRPRARAVAAPRLLPPPRRLRGSGLGDRWLQR